MSAGDPIAAVLGVAQLPMRTRQPQSTFADLLGRVAQGAIADAGVEPHEVDGMLLAQAPTTLLGVDEPQLWGLAGLPASTRFLGRVHAAAASGIAAFRVACAHVAAGRARRVLVLAADLADEVPNLAGAIGQLGDPFTEKQYPRTAITAAALQMAAYMAAHRADERDMAHVIVKNRANGVDNECAQLRKAVTLDEVVTSPPIAWPIKRLDSSPRTSGAAAVLVGAVRDATPTRRVVATGFGSHACGRMIGAQMVPGHAGQFDGSDLARAAHGAYAMAGVGDPATAIDVAEVYASFGIIELLSIEGLRLAEPGEAARRMAAGEFGRASRLPVNPSGGATCGSPVSATALIRIVEATLQLRGEAGARQVARTPRRAVVAGIGGTFQLHEVGVLQT